MTSVSGFNAPKIELWMVSRLFGATQNSGNEQTGTATDFSSQISTQSRVAVSNATSQAIISVNSSTTSKTAASQEGQDPNTPLQSLTADEGNKISEQLNQMSSKQVSDAMYGDGFTSVQNVGQKVTFQSFLDGQRETEAWGFKQAKNTELSESDRNQILADTLERKTVTNELQTAYNNHTLTFQNASEVQGLDYTMKEEFHSVEAGVGSYSYTDITGSYNQSFIDNESASKNNAVVMYGSVGMYLSW